MTTPIDKLPTDPEVSAEAAPKRTLSPEAQRALQEAAERRAAGEKATSSEDKRREVGGRDGPEPTRYGDWEKGGIISDF
jgi:hypothetical protein